MPWCAAGRQPGSQETFEAGVCWQALTRAPGASWSCMAGFLSHSRPRTSSSRWPRPRSSTSTPPSSRPSAGRGIYGLKVHEAALAVRGEGHRRHRPFCRTRCRTGGDILLQKAVDMSARRHAGGLAAPGHGAGRVEAPAPGCADAVGRRRSAHGESRRSVYENQDLAALLAGNTYPGRGIVLGQTAGQQAVCRRLLHHGPQREQPQPRLCRGAGTASAPRPLTRPRWRTPALIIYHPVRRAGQRHSIVTNGDQTDTVAGYLKAGRVL
ncbi:MAG: IMP cyclohydrolase [Evtepia sp.]